MCGLLCESLTPRLPLLPLIKCGIHSSRTGVTHIAHKLDHEIGGLPADWQGTVEVVYCVCAHEMGGTDFHLITSCVM